uniref:molybdopterin synthase sulfur carrier subunit-like n=1 Tax=Myxine glutinosa TaxID=7769 RepID=UPI00358F5EDA
MTYVEVTVLYFAKSSELAGTREELLTLPAQLTSLELWHAIVQKHPRLESIRGQIVLAVEQQYVELGQQVVCLRHGDEVAVVPPLSGG